MARFGISGIIVDNGNKPKVIFRQRSKGHTMPLWVGNIVFNEKKEGKSLIRGNQTMHDYLQRTYANGSMIISEAVGYLSNENIVKLHDLYPNFNDFFVCFIKSGYNLYLLTLGSKTIQEFRASGHDTRRNSHVPLIVTVKCTESEGKRFVPVNLLPAVREDVSH